MYIKGKGKVVCGGGGDGLRMPDVNVLLFSKGTGQHKHCEQFC